MGVDDSWRLKANCGPGGLILDEHGRPADAAARARVMFPRRGQPNVLAEAMAVCATCPVQDPCLAVALVHQRTPGVWAGTTEEERVLIRRARSSAVA